MRYLLLFSCLYFSLAASAQITYGNNGWRSRDRLTGNGEVTTQSRTVGDFDEVTACCKLRVELRQGATTEVRVEAESNLQDLVETEVRGNRLKIKFKDEANFRSTEPIVVYVTVPSLTYVGGEAGGDLAMVSVFEGERLELDASSGASVTAQFTGALLRAHANSGGHIEVSGSGRAVDVEASSGGSVAAENYTAETAEAEASSGGGVEVNVSKSLEAEASSGGRVRYRGNATDINMRGGSGGSVRKG